MDTKKIQRDFQRRIDYTLSNYKYLANNTKYYAFHVNQKTNYPNSNKENFKDFKGWKQ